MKLTQTFLMLLVLAIVPVASGKEPLPGPVQETSEAIRSRRTFGGALHFSPIDLWVPPKFGASLSWVKSLQTTVELEYLRGSISGGVLGLKLFAIRDERWSVLVRSFFGNSFNLSYGVTHFRASARIEASDFNTPAGNPLPAYDLWKTRGWGVNVGLGNRWMASENLAVGVDWISLAQPLTASHSSDFPEESVNQAVRDDFKWLSYFPRFVFFHFQMGYYF